MGQGLAWRNLCMGAKGRPNLKFLRHLPAKLAQGKNEKRSRILKFQNCLPETIVSPEPSTSQA